MPALNIPAQTTAPRPGMVTHSGPDPDRHHSGTDFGEWMAKAATGGKHQQGAAAENTGGAAASATASAEHPALNGAAQDEAVAACMKAPQEGFVEDDDIPPAPVALSQTSAFPLPDPTEWFLAPENVPLDQAQLRADSSAEMVEGDGELATAGPNSTQPSPLLATLRASATAGTTAYSLDVVKAAADPADTRECGETPAPAAAAPTGHDSATPRAMGTTITAVAHDAAGQYFPARADSEMPGTPAAPLSRDGPAAGTDSVALRLPTQAEPHRQIADAIVRTRSGQVEITLDPVELGRVTVLLGEDGNPGRLALLVERPDTLELIRRHSDQLLRDLRENGMPDARLEDLRRDDSASQGNGPQARAPPEGEGHNQFQPLVTPETTRRVALGRLDIRY